MNNLAQRLLIPVTLRSAAASASLIQRSFTTPRPRASSPWTPKKKDDNTNDTPKSLLKVDSSYEKDVLLWRKDLLEAELRLVKEYLERFPVRKAEADEQVNSNINNKGESHDDVVDKDKDDFMSRVASPTREHLRLKKRKAMSKESVLLMEVDKLKEDLGKAELKIKVLEEENERLRQQQHRDATRSFDMSNACSSTSTKPNAGDDIHLDTTKEHEEDDEQKQLADLFDCFIDGKQGNNEFQTTYLSDGVTIERWWRDGKWFYNFGSVFTSYTIDSSTPRKYPK